MRDIEKKRAYMREYHKIRPPLNWEEFLVEKHVYKKETLDAREKVYDNAVVVLLENDNEDENEEDRTVL